MATTIVEGILNTSISTSTSTKSKDYETHVQNVGWQSAVQLGGAAGTTFK